MDKVLVEYDIQIKNLQSKLKKAEAGFTNTEKKVTASTSRISKNIVSLGTQLVGAFAIASVVRNSINTLVEFEATMSKVKAITGATASEFSQLEKDAKRLGETTRFTASQVGQLQIEYAKLGFTTQEILDATEATLQLSIITGDDLASAAAVAGTTIRAFGLDASETQRVVDLMATSFTSSALDIEKFRESMKLVAPVANAAGFSVEDTTALLAKLADAGISGSLAGTSLRNIFTRLADSSSDLSRQLGGGITNSVQLAEALGKMRDRGVDLSQALELTDRRAVSAFNVLIEGSGTLEVLSEKFSDVTGNAKEMADEISDNLEGDVKRLASAWEGLILTQEEGGSLLREVTQLLTSSVNGLTDAFNFLNIEGRLNQTVNDAIADAQGRVEEELRNSTKSTEELVKARQDEIIQLNLKSALNTAEIGESKAIAKADKDQTEVRIESIKRLEEENFKIDGRINRLKEEILFIGTLKKEKEDEVAVDSKRVGLLEDINQQLKIQKDLLKAATTEQEISFLLKQIELLEQKKDALVSVNEQVKINAQDDKTFREDDLESFKDDLNERLESEAQFNEFRIETLEELEDKERQRAIANAENEMRNVQLFRAGAEVFQQLSNLKTQTEINNINRRFERGEISEQQAESATKQVLRQQAARDKALALFDVGINTAVAITKALATTANPILATVIGIAGAVQAAVIASQPLPRFAKGSENVEGGIAGKDSVHALLMPGERVVTTDKNKKYWDPLHDIHKDSFNDNWIRKDKAIKAQKENSFASNLVNAMRMNQDSFEDERIVRAIEDGTFYSKKSTKILANAINDISRQAKINERNKT